jgi:hypothetical protein
MQYPRFDVIHGRGDPRMTEGLLDRDQVHPAQVKLRGIGYLYLIL